MSLSVKLCKTLNIIIMSLLSLNSYQSYKEVKASIQLVNSSTATNDTVKLSGYAKPIAIKKSQSDRLLKWQQTGNANLPNRVKATIKEVRENDSGRVLKAELVYFETLGCRLAVA